MFLTFYPASIIPGEVKGRMGDLFWEGWVWIGCLEEEGVCLFKEIFLGSGVIGF